MFRKMHVHQVWCELVEHNSFVSFQSEDQVAPFYDSQVARVVVEVMIGDGALRSTSIVIRFDCRGNTLYTVYIYIFIRQKGSRNK